MPVVLLQIVEAFWCSVLFIYLDEVVYAWILELHLTQDLSFHVMTKCIAYNVYRYDLL